MKHDTKNLSYFASVKFFSVL